MLLPITVIYIIYFFLLCVFLYIIFIKEFVSTSRKCKLINVYSIFVGFIVGCIVADVFQETNLTPIVYFILLYIIFHGCNWHEKIVNQLLCFLSLHRVSAFIVGFPINIMNWDIVHQMWAWTIVATCLECWIAYWLYKKLNTLFFNEDYVEYSKNVTFFLLLLLIFIESYFIMLYRTFTYDRLLLLSAGIVVCFMVSVFYILSILKKQYYLIYEKKIHEKEIKALLMYANKVEKAQLELRRFRHDYRNLLFSLASASNERNQNDMFNDTLKRLAHYSTQQIAEQDKYYRDLMNIKHDTLKSFLTMKLLDFEAENIPIHFECMSEIMDIAMEEFDLIRVMGVILDNAKEYIEEVGKGDVRLLILQNETKTELIISNSYYEAECDITMLQTEGVSSKAYHEGLGLSNVNHVTDSYPNVYVQYVVSDRFEISISIIK